MSTETTKQGSFKDTVKRAGRKTKDFAGRKAEQVKTYGRGYKNDIRKAYDLGYSRGWDDSYDVPKRLGAKTAAAYGYKKGIKCRRKSDKYNAQYERKGK